MASWQEFEEKIEDYQKDFERKRKLFEGYCSLLAKSLRCSALTLPMPLNLIIDSVYESDNEEQPAGRSKKLEQIIEVAQIIEDVSKRGSKYYMHPRFQNILERIDNSSSNVPEQLKKIHKILVSEDDESAMQLIGELEREFHEADELRRSNNNPESPTRHRDKQIEVFKEEMQNNYSYVEGAFNILSGVVSSVEDAQRRNELRKVSQKMYNSYKYLKQQLNVDMSQYEHIRHMYLQVEGRFPDPSGE